MPASEHAGARYREPLGTLTLPVLGASLGWSVAFSVGGVRWSSSVLTASIVLLAIALTLAALGVRRLMRPPRS